MSILELAELIRRRFLTFMLFVAGGAYGLYVFVESRPVGYGYSALLKPARFAGGGDVDKSNPFSSIMNQVSRNLNDFKDQTNNLSALLVYNYGIEALKSRSMDGSEAPLSYLDSVKTFEKSEYLQLTSIGPTPNDAKKFLDKILMDIRKEDEVRIHDKIIAIQEQISTVKKQLLEKREQVEKIEKNLKLLGHSPTLLEAREKLSLLIIQLMSSETILTQSISPASLYNHTYVQIRPVQSRPMFPNKVKLYALGGCGVFFLAFLVILFLDLFFPPRRYAVAPLRRSTSGTSAGIDFSGKDEFTMTSLRPPGSLPAAIETRKKTG